MKNAMQLKAVVKNIAKEKSISAQLILQNYMLERFLERVCEYRFICLDVFITTPVQYRFLFKSEYRFVPVEALREEIKIRLNHL